MASTGEVAAFGSDIAEAYWASLTSTNGFRVPVAGSGVLLGGDISCPQLATVAKGLSELGFKLYCSSPIVEEFLNSLPYVKAEKIFFPLKDKRKLREVFDEADIQSLINLAKGRAKDTLNEDYVARRNAVDFGVPLINNPLIADLYVKALGRKMKLGEVGPVSNYVEGRVPSMVKASFRWRVLLTRRERSGHRWCTSAQSTGRPCAQVRWPLWTPARTSCHELIAVLSFPHSVEFRRILSPPHRVVSHLMSTTLATYKSSGRGHLSLFFIPTPHYLRDRSLPPHATQP